MQLNNVNLMVVVDGNVCAEKDTKEVESHVKVRCFLVKLQIPEENFFSFPKNIIPTNLFLVFQTKVDRESVEISTSIIC